MPQETPSYSQLENELEKAIGAGGGLFCGQNSEGFAINGVTYQWERGSKLTWGVAFTRLGALTRDDVISAVKEFLKEITDCCDLFFSFTENANAANIKLTSQRLDGPSGVLADMQIPPPGSKASDTQLLGRFDDGENWGLYDNPPNGTIDFYRTALHEWEHACGLGHKPPSIQVPALISPIYSPTMRHLQKADKDELVRRYGVAQAPPVVPPPVAGRKPVNCEIEQGGLKWRGVLSPIN